MRSFSKHVATRFPLHPLSALLPIPCAQSQPTVFLLSLTRLLPRRVRIHRPLPTGTRRVVIQPQLPPIKFPAIQLFQRCLGTLHIRKVRVRKATRLACSPINGHAHIDDVGDAAEQVVEILVRHLERHVADEERLGGRVLATSGLRARLGHGVLHDDATAFEALHVHRFNGFGGAGGVVEFDVAETMKGLEC